MEDDGSGKYNTHRFIGPGTYCIINSSNGWVFVGSTKKDIADRINYHRYLLKRGIHSNKKLQDDWNEFGAKSFKSIIVRLKPNKEDSTRDDQDLIEEYRKLGKSYNVSNSAFREDHNGVLLSFDDSFDAATNGSRDERIAKIMKFIDSAVSEDV